MDNAQLHWSWMKGSQWMLSQEAAHALQNLDYAAKE